MNNKYEKILFISSAIALPLLYLFQKYPDLFSNLKRELLINPITSLVGLIIVFRLVFKFLKLDSVFAPKITKTTYNKGQTIIRSGGQTTIKDRKNIQQSFDCLLSNMPRYIRELMERDDLRERFWQIDATKKIIDELVRDNPRITDDELRQKIKSGLIQEAIKRNESLFQNDNI